MMRAIRERLARGIAIPRSRRVVRVTIEHGGADDPVARTVVARHVERLVELVPELERYWHPSVGESSTAATTFLAFANDFVPLVRAEAREPHIRSLLTRLRGGIVDPAHLRLIGERIAESDLESGLPERALVLLEGDDPEVVRALQSEIEAADAAYEAPLIAGLSTWQRLEGDARGRSLLAALEPRTDRLRGAAVLHCAPETDTRAWFERRREALGLTYVTLDAFSADVDLRADLTDLPIEAETFDLVLCHRVLEHVLDDRRALTELHRILRPGGELNVSIPQSMHRPTNEWLVQDESHHGHVRHYGGDFSERLRETGFEVEIDRTLLDRPREAHMAAQTYPLRIYRATKTSSLSTSR
jgi:hypothetical protein